MLNPSDPTLRDCPYFDDLPTFEAVEVQKLVVDQADRFEGLVCKLNFHLESAMVNKHEVRIQAVTEAYHCVWVLNLFRLDKLEKSALGGERERVENGNTRDQFVLGDGC